MILCNNLQKSCSSDEEVAKKYFLYVRDEIRHSRDYQDDRTTCKVSDVLQKLYF